MSPSLAVLTWALMALPPFLVYQGSRAPEPVRWTMYGTAAFVVLLYVVVWFWWRPSAFELTDDALVIHWPWRRRSWPLSGFTAAELTDFNRIHARHGRGMRVGAGGLFGAFGRYVTRKTTFQMYVSRFDELLVLEGPERPLLISPADAQAFLFRIQQRLGGRR